MNRSINRDLHGLECYQVALDLYRQVNGLLSAFPRGEADLRSQMKRAVRSVVFNLGEGAGKRGKARIAAYEIARGETKELLVALDCVEIEELAPPEQIEGAQELADRVAAMLTRMIRSVERRLSSADRS